ISLIRAKLLSGTEIQKLWGRIIQLVKTEISRTNNGFIFKLCGRILQEIVDITTEKSIFLRKILNEFLIYLYMENKNTNENLYYLLHQVNDNKNFVNVLYYPRLLDIYDKNLLLETAMQKLKADESDVPDDLRKNILRIRSAIF